ncbi:isoprenoid biosynthesis glyoxalase ElbB [Cysteiniphilum halobium]|uniref:isoprenoid biosynthesis glyoxalase ElbB n=1 Tax=Cysteiniphilum halobium TaxID=2219059 RepID=UPI003F868F11
MVGTKKVAILLAGCGVYDGSEIHEAVLTLLSLSKRGIKYEMIAPNMMQRHVINHITGDEESQTRNVLVEAARIARGQIKDLRLAYPDDYAALIIPGGFGVAKNLCDFAFKQDSSFSVEPAVAEFINKFKNVHKPVGFICISPVIAAELYPNAKLTIGNDQATADIIEHKGAKHVNQCVTEVCVDQINKVVSTPAYMLGQSIAEVALGIDHLVEAVVSLMTDEALVSSDVK